MKTFVVLLFSCLTISTSLAQAEVWPQIVPTSHWGDNWEFRDLPNDPTNSYSAWGLTVYTFGYGIFFLGGSWQLHDGLPLYSYSYGDWPHTDWPITDWTYMRWTNVYDGETYGDYWEDPSPPPWFHIAFACRYLQEPITYLGSTGLYKTFLYRDAYLQMWSGGVTNVPGTGFFKLTAHASDYFAASYTPIPITNFLVRDMRCDADGNTYHALADNFSYDCTVFGQQNGVTNYSYGFTSVEKARLQIRRGGADVTDKTNTVIVGEQMALTCQFIGLDGLPSSIAPITNFQWTIAGNIVSNYVPSTPTLLHDGTTVVKTNASTFFHWSQLGSGLVVQCTAIAKGVTMVVKTTFDVMAPTYELELCPSNTVGIHLPFVYGIHYFHFGDGQTNHGMNFFARPQNLVETNFTIGFLQVGKSISQRFFEGGTQQQRVHTNDWFLDTPAAGEYLYPAQPRTNLTYGAFTNGLYARDSPGQHLFPLLSTMVRISRNDNFETFVMYKTGKPGIWVPLVKLAWSWSGTAEWGTQWSLTASNYAPTSCSSASGSGNGTFPTWTKTWVPTVESNWTTF
jgi:hypothetical protein